MSRRLMVTAILAALVGGLSAVKLAGGPAGVRLRIKQVFAPTPISREDFDRLYTAPCPPFARR